MAGCPWCKSACDELISSRIEGDDAECSIVKNEQSACGRRRCMEEKSTLYQCYN